MERIVHNPVDLVVEVPRPVVVEKSVQVPMIHVEEKTVRVPKARRNAAKMVGLLFCCQIKLKKRAD